MKFLGLIFLVASTLAADVVDPESCTSYPCMIFEDTFDFFDHDVWEHEITLSGGGNYEFQAYVNNRSISYTRDGVLYIKPALTADWQGEDFLSSGTLNFWGAQAKNDICTSNLNYGCERVGTDANIVNPIMSARLRTVNDFAFKFGRVEVVAKMPRGQWLWPAVWMLPQYFKYGPWPASGEIDIVESRGNDNYGDHGNEYAGSTLHWGPYYQLNRWDLTHAEYSSPSGGSFADAFHTWVFEWTDTDMTFYLDDVLVLTVDPVTSFFDLAGYAGEMDIDNPWIGGGKMAPFNEKFYFVLNLAVGGTGGFFPDSIPSDPPKPWVDTSLTALTDFWNGRDLWLPSWTGEDGKISENAALKVESVRVYKLNSD